MFDEVIEAWKAFLKKILSYSKETHQEVAPLWLQYDQTVTSHETGGMMDVEFEETMGGIRDRISQIFDEAETEDASTEVTVAIGWFLDAPRYRFVKAKQKTSAPTFLEGMYPPPGYLGEPLVDAHDLLQNHDYAWYSEKTGIHAEVMIIRTWLRDLGQVNEAGLLALGGRSVIVASQPACWCCAALMTKYNIAYPSDLGKKPRTGWRHPLASRTVPNSSIPAQKSGIAAWIDRAKAYTGLF